RAGDAGPRRLLGCQQARSLGHELRAERALERVAWLGAREHVAHLEALTRRDERAQRAQRAELDAADRAVALADDLRDRLRVIALDVTQDEDLLLERRELLHRLADHGRVRASEQRGVGIDDLIRV